MCQTVEVAFRRHILPISTKRIRLDGMGFAARRPPIIGVDAGGIRKAPTGDAYSPGSIPQSGCGNAAARAIAVTMVAAGGNGSGVRGWLLLPRRR